MGRFYMNGRPWTVIFVEPDNPVLVDRTDTMRVATTSPADGAIYLSKSLHGSFLKRVLLHELCHAAMISYDMLYEMHRMTKPTYWIDMEESICNIIADKGPEIMSIANGLLGQ